MFQKKGQAKRTWRFNARSINPLRICRCLCAPGSWPDRTWTPYWIWRPRVAMLKIYPRRRNFALHWIPGRYFTRIIKVKGKEDKGIKLANEAREEKRGITMQIAVKLVLSSYARGMVGWPLNKGRKKLAHSARGMVGWPLNKGREKLAHSAREMVGWPLNKWRKKLAHSARGMVGWPLHKGRKKLAHSAQLSVSLIFLPNFDVLRDHLLKRATAT